MLNLYLLFSTILPLLSIIITPLSALSKPVNLNKRYSSVLIVSSRTGKCLSASPAVGAPVNLIPCSGASRWDINPGSGSVILSGSGLALDAGVSPGNFGRLKVWTSYPGLYQQTWFLTGDNRIAITGGNQCLDDDGTNLQTYQCTTGNTNQVFFIQERPLPPSSSSSTPSSTSSQPPASSSASPPPLVIPPGTIYPDPPYVGRRLHPLGRADLCATAMNGGNSNGQAVAVTYCFPNDSEFAANQFWDIPAKGSSGPLKLQSKPFCIDAGVNPSNNVALKIWDCYNGLYQQTWTRSNDDKFYLPNNQCMDVRDGSIPRELQPYPSLRDLQTYQCFPGNTNQIFTLYG